MRYSAKQLECYFLDVFGCCQRKNNLIRLSLTFKAVLHKKLNKTFSVLGCFQQNVILGCFKKNSLNVTAFVLGCFQ